VADFSGSRESDAGQLQQAQGDQGGQQAFGQGGDVAGSNTRFTSSGPIPAVSTGGRGGGGMSPSDRAYGTPLNFGPGHQARVESKPAGPPEKLSDADKVVETNVRAAQNMVEELLALASDEHVDVKKLDSKLTRATLYLNEAVATMGEANANSGNIEAALASLSDYETKLQNLIHMRALAQRPDSAAYEDLRHEPMQQFLLAEGTLMRRFGIPAKPAPVATLGKGKDAGAPEVDAIEASLHLAEVHAKQGFDQLVAQGGTVTQRDSIVKAATLQIYAHVSHATTMSNALDPEHRAALKPSIDAVSTNLLLMKRWMDGREGNKVMIDTFAPVLIQLNGVRNTVGLDAVDLEAAKGFPEREEAKEVNEHRDMDGAVNTYGQAWESLSRAMETGVDDWFDLAQKAKENKPSFVEKLLEGLVDGVFGIIGGKISEALFEAAAKEVKEHLIEISTEVIKGGGQGILMLALEAGKKEGAKETDLKALHSVRGSMKAICRGLEAQHVIALNKQRSSGELSISNVNELEAAARGAEKTANASLKFQSAVEWSKYMARAGMGGESGETKDGATDMGGYYGTYVPSGPRQAAYRANNHEGTAGVLRVKVKDYEPGIAGHSGVLSIDSIDVNGMNDEMTELLKSDPSIKTLDDMKVPKEISVEYKVHLQRATVAHPTLKFAVDEMGRVKDSLAVQDDDTDPPGDTSVWDQVRKLPIPKSEASP
jgi:hypothetical protein